VDNAQTGRLADEAHIVRSDLVDAFTGRAAEQVHVARVRRQE
jgi:hypothetical protein